MSDLDKDELEEVEDSKDNQNDEYEKVCYLCHRSESKTGKMIDLPQNISICPDCMQKTFDTMNSGGMGDIFKGGIPGIPGMPGIQFINMSDIDRKSVV